MASQVSPDGSGPFLDLQFSSFRQGVGEKIPKYIRIRVLCQFQQVSQVKLKMAGELQQQLKRHACQIMFRKQIDATQFDRAFLTNLVDTIEPLQEDWTPFVAV